MDPYLELPSLWPDVHARIIYELAHTLHPLVRPHYHVRFETRFTDVPASDLVALDVVGIGDVLVTKRAGHSPPSNGRGGGAVDGESARAERVEPESTGPAVLTVELPYTVEVRERYLEIRDAATHEVVTVIEVLSPTNKRTGAGRRKYEEKRAEVTASRTSLVEIDLLRGGGVLPVWRDDQPLPSTLARDYRALVSRGYEHPRATLYAVTVRDRLPTIPIPLRRGETEPLVDLQAIITAIYDDGDYDEILDYHREPVPPLKPEDAAWSDALLHAAGKR